MLKRGKAMRLHGKPVIDAHKALQLSIENSDIEGSKRKNPEKCAAARALCRQENRKSAEVYLSRAYVLANNGKYYVRYMVPPALRFEVGGFDRGAKFQKGIYTLHAIQPTKRLGAPRSTPRSKDTRKRHDRGSPKLPNRILENVRPRMPTLGK